MTEIGGAGDGSGPDSDAARIQAALDQPAWRDGYLSLRGLGLRTLPDLGIADRLVGLDLSGNRLRDLPAWLWAASNLQRLVVAGNRLVLIPAEISRLRALRELDASDNPRLRAIDPAISDCHQLRRLDLSGGDLDDLGPLSLLTGLLVLDAAGNRIADVPLAPSPATLRSLDLSGNRLMTVPASFRQFSVLTRLDLSANALTSATVDRLAELPLEELYLDDNQLEEPVELPGVRRLSLLGNPYLGQPQLPWLADRPDTPPPMGEQPRSGSEPQPTSVTTVLEGLSGGAEPDRHYFDAPTYTFGTVLALDDPVDTERALDLHHKRFPNLPATLAFADRSTMQITELSRRTAVQYVREHQQAGQQSLISLPASNNRDQVAAGVAFLTQAVARADRAQLLTDGEPVPFEQPSRSPGPRVLNVALTDEDGRLLPTHGALVVSRGYRVRVDLGAVVEDSVVINPIPLRTEALEPDSSEGWQFQVVVSSSDVTVAPTVVPLFLPLSGRSAMVEIPFGTPDQPGPARLRVTLYHRNSVVQSARVDFELTETGAGAGEIIGVIDFALTDDVARAEELPVRELSVLTNGAAGGTHTIVVSNGERAMAVDVSETRATEVLSVVRARLIEITLGPDGKTSQYDADNRTSPERFREDIARLAQTGAQLYQSLIPDVDDRAYLKEHLARRSRIQITRATPTTFPWALVYDIARDPAAPGIPCPLLTGWPAEQLGLADYPEQCPHQEAHRMNTVCPYGFWGFRHQIEQPLPVRHGSARTEIRFTQPSRAAAARSLTLDATLTEHHFTELANCFAGQFTIVACDSTAALQAAFTDPSLPLAYFYCHGKKGLYGGLPAPYLEIGQADDIVPGSLAAWHDGLGWGAGHWRETAPLVFLNGCETTDLEPADVVNFVDAFAGIRAAGVIGTEIPMSQLVAGEIALSFYRQFAGASHASVGTALYRTRIDLLRKGNIAGLLYTPYCSMDLTLVPA